MRPYTTAEVIALYAARGVKMTGGYISNVIHDKKRLTPHPLHAAHLARGMWDRELVDHYFDNYHDLDGRRARVKDASPKTPRRATSKPDKSA